MSIELILWIMAISSGISLGIKYPVFTMGFLLAVGLALTLIGIYL